ncbi:abortive infection system antitoxin AbiGi family protein [Telluribacter sp.]|jgi:hypothetical protein|uniref:abortive infection system antitoxin AbiGi family protein n=1 Tax=Telluribacter sp. TaxID=1978767 RepID=UPI002E124914|nr:abortive infection system antitoxin AbiGi family protein [Telluribacter sp.]
MALSSNSLFHFTRGGYEAIQSILKDGFWIKYRCEDMPQNMLKGIYSSNTSESITERDASINEGVMFKQYLYIPMVSFCDIPLSNTREHLRFYGSEHQVEKVGKKEIKYLGYAIGLSKEWAVTKRMNPLIYIAHNSHLAQSLVYQHKLDQLKKIESWPPNINIDPPVVYYPPVPIDLDKGIIQDQYGNQFPTSYLYVKPVSKINYHIGKEYPVRYQDEKEWRYIPDDACIIYDKQRLFSSNHAIFYESFNTNRDRALKEVSDKYDNLTFSHQDITHIIVGKNEEIPAIQREIELVYGSVASPDELRLLYSKVTSYETLEKDVFSS